MSHKSDNKRWYVTGYVEGVRMGALCYEWEQVVQATWELAQCGGKSIAVSDWSNKYYS